MKPRIDPDANKSNIIFFLHENTAIIPIFAANQQAMLVLHYSFED